MHVLKPTVRDSDFSESCPSTNISSNSMTPQVKPWKGLCFQIRWPNAIGPWFTWSSVFCMFLAAHCGFYGDSFTVKYVCNTVLYKLDVGCWCFPYLPMVLLTMFLGTSIDGNGTNDGNNSISEVPSLAFPSSWVVNLSGNSTKYNLQQNAHHV